MHVDDLARALLFLMQGVNSPEAINVGWGIDVSIAELAELIKMKTGFRHDIRWDRSKPDGMPRKCLDISKLSSLGFKPSISLEEGVEATIHHYLNDIEKRG